MKKKIRNLTDEEIEVEEKEELFDYLIKFIKNVEISDKGMYYVSFKNNTPYLDCIEIDKDHYNKFKKIKESQKGENKYIDFCKENSKNE